MFGGMLKNQPGLQNVMKLFSRQSTAVAATTLTTEQTLFTTTLPAGLLGLNSRLIINPYISWTNSAGNKTLRIKINGVTAWTVVNTTSATMEILFWLQNRNSMTSQIGRQVLTIGAASSSGSIVKTDNYANDVVITITGQVAVGTDTLTLEDVLISYYS